MRAGLQLGGVAWEGHALPECAVKGRRGEASQMATAHGWEAYHHAALAMLDGLRMQ